MNYITCIVRLFEIPHIELASNNTPFIQFNVELPQVRNRLQSIIIKAIIWGDLAFSLLEYMTVNDYLLIEAYIFNNYSFTDDLIKLNAKPKLNIYRIYPLFISMDSKVLL